MLQVGPSDEKASQTQFHTGNEAEFVRSDSKGPQQSLHNTPEYQRWQEQVRRRQEEVSRGRGSEWGRGSARVLRRGSGDGEQGFRRQSF